MIEKLLPLIIAPIIVGAVLELFAYWLEKQDDN
ncbi:type I toxin-antitoxin system Fst family toxin [Enterococcus faecalis]|nr:type I toxin-antitoxin system Fst family toxin [Enterococcus faecalis]